MAARLGDTNLTAGGPRPCGGALCCCPGAIVILNVATAREGVLRPPSGRIRHRRQRAGVPG
jgi:hypothetical protein